MASTCGHRVLRHRDRAPGPWANGGGITYEIARSSENAEDFDWRMSVAEVATEGPFSHFPGIDRVLIMLRGSMRVEIDGEAREVVPLTPLRFPGEAQVTAFLPHGPTMDVNVMTRRGRMQADVSIDTGGNVELPAAAETLSTAIVLDGTWAFDGLGEPLTTADCVMADGPLALHGSGTLAVVKLRDVTR